MIEFFLLVTFKWWDISNGHHSKTFSVEATAYALLTLMTNKANMDCLPIFQWLLTQRNDTGGFEGTQDTVIGIEALARFATKLDADNKQLTVTIDASDNTKINFYVNKNNGMTLQSQEVGFYIFFKTNYSF